MGNNLSPDFPRDRRIFICYITIHAYTRTSIEITYSRSSGFDVRSQRGSNRVARQIFNRDCTLQMFYHQRLSYRIAYSIATLVFPAFPINPRSAKEDPRRRTTRAEQRLSSNDVQDFRILSTIALVIRRIRDAIRPARRSIDRSIQWIGTMHAHTRARAPACPSAHFLLLDCDRVEAISAKVGGNVYSPGRSCRLCDRFIDRSGRSARSGSRVRRLANISELRASPVASNERSRGRQVRVEASLFGINVLSTTKQELFPLGSLPFVTVCGLCVRASRESIQSVHLRLLPPPPPLSLSHAFPPRSRMARPSVPHPASHDATQSGIRSVPELYSR